METATTQKFTLNNLPAGWYWKSTPGHGYLYLPTEANKKIPSSIRMDRYEEDCAYSIPIVIHAELFTEETVKQCAETFKNWHPKEYEIAFNVTLEKGESYLKDEYYYAAIENTGKYTTRAAWGNWKEGVPKGQVLVLAGMVTPPTTDQYCQLRQYTKDEQYYLIPEEEYKGGMYFEKDKYPTTDIMCKEY